MESRDCKAPQAVMIENHPQDSWVKISEDGIVQTLSGKMGTGGNTPMVMERDTAAQYRKCWEEGVYQLCDCGQCPHKGNCKHFNKNPNPATNYVARRLTPLEAERLQGFPDKWTDIGEWVDSKGKKHKDADSPRYKALGNSIALPFWEWMAKRMVKYLDAETPTMASLFDGIGGFALVYERAGCRAVWASEIEEFPIAVTTKHFGDEERGIKGDLWEKERR